jgi:DNA-binding Lrp family transcriptional regulator
MPDETTQSALTPFEAAILNYIQQGFPISAEPYGEIAVEVGSTREDVHAAVQSLRERKIIRRIGGSFAAKQLGYVSILVAAQVDTEHLETVAAVVSSFPEVTHNYERAGIYNLWFTVIAETPERQEEILQHVRQCAGVHGVYPLPATRTFKIKVDFKFAQGGNRG